MDRVKKLQAEVRELREWKRRLSLLLDFAKKITAKKDLDSLLRLLVQMALDILEAERCSIFLLDKRTNELWTRMATGDHEIRVPAGLGVVGEAVTQRRIINIVDAYSDPRFNPDVDRRTGFTTRSLLTAPMMNNKGDVIGVFQVLNKKRGPFHANDEEILLVFAEQASAPIENAQLNEEIRIAAKDTIIRLAAAAEYKDHDTRRHLERMSRYGEIIADEIGMPLAWRNNLALAGPMHDIGKLGVPDAILKKPGKLNEDEWVEMRKHPVYGSEILKNSDNELIQMSERVARSHHEKWDGSGYPYGLKGEEIPLEGRIVAIADVFDALTSRRVYKPAMALDETLRIIREGAGKHFDPTLVDAFFRALPRLLNVKEEFSELDTPVNPTPRLPTPSHAA